MFKIEIQNALQKAIDCNYTIFSDFYTPNMYKNIPENYNNINIYSFGKIRKILAFVPDYIDNFEFPIKLIKIEVHNKFKNYTNSDFLGSIMALNIERKYFGDLFVKDNTAFIYAKDSIVDYLMNNLNKVGNNNCIVSLVNEEIELDFEYKTININVSSNRLDTIISKITNLSRNETQEYIENGLCMVDYEIILDKSKVIKQDSILSLRGYGRYIVGDTIKHSKKNRPIIQIKEFK